MLVNLALPYQSTPSGPRSPRVTFVSRQRPDLLFQAGDAAELLCLPYPRALSLHWTLHHNGVRTPLANGDAAVDYDNSVTLKLPLASLAPGFYDVRVALTVSDTEAVEAITTVGWRVGELPIACACPADFDRFWQRARTAVDAIAPKPTVELERTLRGTEIDAYNRTSAALPGNYDPTGAVCSEVEVYRVRFPTLGGRTVEGWYAKPAGRGPVRPLLILPGAGNGRRPAPVEHARHGYAALDLQIHGYPVDAATYPELPADNVAVPEQSVSFAKYVNALQGARALRLLPGVAAGGFAVLGGSQGGQLSFVVAALDPDCRAAIAAITHYAYLPWWRWTERMNAAHDAGGAGFAAIAAGLAPNGESYFDVVNFARRVRCPVLMNAGLIDPISPPTGVYAAYQALTASKEIVALPNTGHDWSPAFDRHAWRWLQRQL